MTNQDILTKAIQKAIDGGWKTPSQDLIFGAVRSSGRSTIAAYYINGIIFNKSFAKALWGEKEVDYYDIVDLDNGGKTEIVTMPIWHYRLKQMVIAEDPIKYLGENL